MTYRLIFDCGATKSTAILMRNGKYHKHLKLDGFNASTSNNISQDLSTILQEVSSVLSYNFDQIEFCGAGCAATQVKEEVRSTLSSFFKAVSITISDDLSFIPRVLEYTEPCIIVIMGTGSNVGYWDGSKMHNELSGGYLIGDEGSGFRLGQKLLSNYLRNNLSPKTQAILDLKINMSKETLLKKIYQTPNPNQFIASFSTMYNEVNDNRLNEIRTELFKEFAFERIRPLKDKVQIIHLFGSVAYFNQEYIRPIIEELNLQIGMVAQGPLDLIIRK